MDEDDEPMCRFCFEGQEAGELISPCNCKGGQKWVHLGCLRRWQRMVLVSQPTHPSFYSDDERHHICNVCTGEFTCVPPTRQELMTSFTGPEVAAMIAPGYMIGAREEFSMMLEEEVRRSPLTILVYKHWIRGAYLITDVHSGFELAEINIESKQMALEIMEILGPECATADLRLVPEFALEGCPDEPEAMRQAMSQLEPPYRIACKPIKEPTCSEDAVTAVNLTAQIPFDYLDSHKKGKVTAEFGLAVQENAAARDVPVAYHNGGPVSSDDITFCLVMGGSCGYSIVSGSMHEALLLSASLTAENIADISVGDTVRLIGLEKRHDLVGRIGIVQRFNDVRWEVRLQGTDEVKKVKTENLEKVATGVVSVFFGSAGWSRVQLLGEIAKGDWGLCKGSVGDLISNNTWNDVTPRLIFAPMSEMTDDQVKQMVALREKAKMAEQHALS